MSAPALAVEHLTHRYADRTALDDVSFEVAGGTTVAVLGPNGGGKSTLFRICATLLRPTSGTARVCGADVVRAPHEARRRLGVVFQSPALDTRLTVRENLLHHGRLHGLRGPALRDAVTAALARVQLAERAEDLVVRLSGGLRRRAELAKVLLTAPDVLLLDEPTVGLDPGARREIWRDLAAMRADTGGTVILTTHLLDEAETADRVLILDRGRIVADGPPGTLTREVGRDVIRLQTADPESLAARITARLALPASLVDGEIRIEHEEAYTLVAALFDAFPAEIRAVRVGRPTLEDVFVHCTGRRFE
jgi:ABC-2 type transport system ATP-binding protein